MCKIKIPEMTESEWDKFFEDGVLTPTRIVNSLWYSKDDVEAYLKEVKAVGDGREQKLEAIKKREPFCCGYPIIDELDRNNYVAVFRCGNCFRIWVEFLGVEE